ncbi:MAG TPA: hypothetical protein DCP92_22665 [Nitrospiraceae bacterium]|nr:hypothetical protein [Nitrospiraceae bacterium]
MKRTQGILQAVGVIAHPEVLGQLRDKLVADAEGFNVHRRQNKIIHKWLGWEGRRSHQAVACRKRYVVELGKPQRFLMTVGMEANELTDQRVRSSRVRRGV